MNNIRYLLPSFLASMILTMNANAIDNCNSATDYSNVEGCRIFSENQYSGNGYIDVKRFPSGTSSSNSVFFFAPFDPDGESTINNIYTTLVPQLIRDRLSSSGYDVFVFDFSDNTFDYLQNKGEAAYTAIKAVEETFGVSSSVALGYSLGGLVSRYALAKLEQDNYDHSVRTYISYDSPHNGANMPIGFQDAVIFMHDGLNKANTRNSDFFSSNWITYFTTQIPLDLMRRQASLVAEGNLRQPATQQMLINYQGQNGSHPLRTQLLTELSDLGFPKDTRTVSFVNGSSNANFTFEGNRFWLYDSSKKNYTDWTFDISADDATNKVMYGKFYFWDPDWDDAESRYKYERRKDQVHLAGIYHLDRNIPCSTTDAPLQIATSMSSGIDLVFGTDYNHIYQDEACFIPVSSALGVSESLYSLTPDQIIATYGRSAIPFDDFYINESNSTHLDEEAFAAELEFEIFNRHDLVWLTPVITSILL